MGHAPAAGRSRRPNARPPPRLHPPPCRADVPGRDGRGRLQQQRGGVRRGRAVLRVRRGRRRQGPGRRAGARAGRGWRGGAGRGGAGRGGRRATRAQGLQAPALRGAQKCGRPHAPLPPRVCPSRRQAKAAFRQLDAAFGRLATKLPTGDMEQQGRQVGGNAQSRAARVRVCCCSSVRPASRAQGGGLIARGASATPSSRADQGPDGRRRRRGGRRRRGQRRRAHVTPRTARM
jgi:hypothetical protein